MDRPSVEKLLRLRSQLVRLPYGESMVGAWTEALSDVSEHDGLRALRALASDGVKDIAIPEIRNWLRGERLAAERVRQITTGGTRDEGCTCSQKELCAMHRRINLEGIARIRAERGWK